MGAAYPAGLIDIKGETIKLSRMIASVGFPGSETKQARIKCVDSDFRLKINPALRDSRFYDASNSAGSRFESVGYTSDGNLTRDLTNRNQYGTGSAMDSSTTSDRLYLCFTMPIGGIHVEMKTRNGNAAVLTANYWNGSSFTSTGATDGTSKQGATLNQDGDITWGEKSDWQAGTFGGKQYLNMNITDVDAPVTNGYWLQLLWSASLAADVEIANIWSINESPATKASDHGYCEGGEWHDISFDSRNIGAIQAFIDDDEIDEADLKITWLSTTKE